MHARNVNIFGCTWQAIALYILRSLVSLSGPTAARTACLFFLLDSWVVWLAEVAGLTVALCSTLFKFESDSVSICLLKLIWKHENDIVTRHLYFNDSNDIRPSFLCFAVLYFIGSFCSCCFIKLRCVGKQLRVRRPIKLCTGESPIRSVGVALQCGNANRWSFPLAFPSSIRIYSFYCVSAHALDRG